MTVADKVIRVLELAGRPMDDDVIAARLHVVRQQVNQSCRLLEERGVLRRVPSPGGRILNELLPPSPDADRPLEARASAPRRQLPEDPWRVSEDEVKAAVKQHLESQGFAVTVAWGRERGIDIDARRGAERWVIEAKGGAPGGPQQVNYFLGALGELVQRMSDIDARYALALPDDRQYRGLVSRLPDAARRRLDLTVFFVHRSEDGALVVAVDKPPAGQGA